mgnify:CR=1 FL=1
MNKNKKKPNPIDIHVGSRVRLRRTMLGMSQEKLGDSLGITFQQVQKYETGANRVSASRLFDVANALCVAPGFFFEGLAEPENTDTPTSRDEASLLILFRSSVPTAQQALLRIAAETAQARA